MIEKLGEEQRGWNQTRMYLVGGGMKTKPESNGTELALKNPTGNFTVKRKSWEEE